MLSLSDLQMALPYVDNPKQTEQNRGQSRDFSSSSSSSFLKKCPYFSGDGIFIRLSQFYLFCTIGEGMRW